MILCSLKMSILLQNEPWSFVNAVVGPGTFREHGVPAVSGGLASKPNWGQVHLGNVNPSR